MRGLASIVALCLVVTASVACPQRATRTAPTTVAGGGRDAVSETVVLPVPEDRGVAARRAGGTRAGVVVSLPRGWTARSVDGDGPVTAVAFGPPRTGVVLELRTWDGDPASLDELMTGDPWGWTAHGPYAEITGADGEPLVATFRESTGPDPSRDRIGLAWFFTVEGRGVGMIARVPATRLEAGFHAAWGVVVTASAPGDDS